MHDVEKYKFHLNRNRVKQVPSTFLFPPFLSINNNNTKMRMLLTQRELKGRVRTRKFSLSSNWSKHSPPLSRASNFFDSIIALLSPDSGEQCLLHTSSTGSSAFNFLVNLFTAAFHTWNGLVGTFHLKIS